MWKYTKENKIVLMYSEGLNMTFSYDKFILKKQRNYKNMTNGQMELNLFDNRLKVNTTHYNTFLVDTFHVSNIKQ